ncbi:MAG TPA: hypothetical protein VK172_14845 [Lentimicrobium sp.]|nr:hypothetical protein [Bacteroidales bacterium]HLO92440.1 hypothetical protein [Lentimicrobium sp.]
MKTYISHLGMTYVSHNKAEEAALKVAQQFNRRVVPEDRVKDFRHEFFVAIEKVNMQFRRCKDLELTITDYDHSGDLDFSISGGLFHLHLYWGEQLWKTKKK